jgi:hypothetical protein
VLQKPNSRESLFLPHRGGRSRFRYGGKGTNPLTRECDIWHIGSNIRVQVPEVSHSGAKGAHSGAREEKGLENGRRWSAGKTEFYLIGRNSVIIKCPSTIASFLREPDLASRKPVLTPGVARSQLQRVLAT